MTESHFNFLLFLQLVACAFMTGVIWMIQILNYPAFEAIDQARFLEFHDQHSKRITFIVGPMMLLELATAGLLLAFRPSSHELIANFVLIIAIWLFTFLLSVPLHNALGRKRDVERIERLVITNWPRTIAWSLRLGLLLTFIVTRPG
jgi:uncharacterized membrane protein